MALITDEEVTASNEEGSWWLSWRPTSLCMLEVFEKRLLAGVQTAIRSYFVPISNGNLIRTLELNSCRGAKPALVLLHGFGAGVALWSLNLDGLAHNHSVYAMDLLGFGRSSRPSFPSDPAEAEDLFVSSIEEWREKVGLDKMILLGHSFGSYVACAYTIKHPEHVKHLVLADPWGVAERPPPGEEPIKIPRWAKVIGAMLSPFNPLAMVRAAGPLGPALVRRTRPDIQKKYAKLYGKDDTSVLEYVYHCNAQSPSGETAFKSLTIPFGYAKFPMIHRVKDISEDIPMSILYGSRTWMDSTQGYKITSLREGSKVDLYTIRGAGHHIYADQQDKFNEIVVEICRKNTEQDSTLSGCSDASNVSDEFELVDGED